MAGAARLADRLIVLNETDRQFRDREPGGSRPIASMSSRTASRIGFSAATARLPLRGAGALFCGAWDRVKGTPYLIGAFQLLAEQGRPVPLTILGCGVPPADVLASLPEVLRPHVAIVDRVSEEEVVAH